MSDSVSHSDSVVCELRNTEADMALAFIYTFLSTQSAWNISTHAHNWRAGADIPRGPRGTAGTGNGEMGNGKWETEMAGNGKRGRELTRFAVLTALLLLVALAVATGRSTIVTVSRLPVLCSGRELFEQQQLFQIEQPNSPHLFSSSSLHLWGQLLIFYSR